MIKAVFFDIDGTLVTRQAEARPATVAALKELKQKKVIRGIATGRGPANLVAQVGDLDLDVFVTYNGQYVYTKKQVVYANAFPKELVQRLAEFATEEKRQILFGSANRLEGSAMMQLGDKPGAKRFQRFLPRGKLLKKLTPVVKRLTQSRQSTDYTTLGIINEPIYQCILISSIGEQAELEARFPECKFTRSNPYTVDIILKDNSKSQGIDRLGNALGFSLEETMAFGDSWNDVEMLRDVKIGVAMGNANEDIKELADYVTGSNEADGIVDALKYFNILEEAN